MKNKTYFWLLLLIGISCVIYFRWLSFGIFSSGDWGFAFHQTFSEYTKWYIWTSNLGLGQLDILLWRAPLNSVLGILGSLGFDQNISEKLIIFWPSIIVANISVFCISKKVIPSNLGALIASLFFNYSTYYFVSSSALLLYASTAYLLASFSFLMFYLERKKLYQYLGFLICYFMTTFFDFRITYIGVFLLGGYILYFQLIIRESTFRKKLFELVAFVPFGILLILLNLYWVIPLSLSNLLTQNTVLNRGLFGNEFLNIFNALTLSHPFWTGGHLAIFDVQKIQAHFWLFPLLAFMGLYLNKSNKKIHFFSFVALLGILLTKQAGSPFTNLYEWLFENFPGFNAFREASKFYVLILLGYGILISSFVYYTESYFSRHNFRKLFFVIVGLVLFTILWQARPILNGEIGSIYREKHIPDDYLEFREKLLSDHEFYRTLWIPTLSRWGFYSNSHPEISAIEVIKNDWYPFIKHLKIEDYFEGEMVTQLIQSDYSARLLDLSSIKYVVVPLLDTANEDDFFVNYGVNRDEYIEILDDLPFLQKVSELSGGTIIYENKEYRDHIYITKSQESLFSDIPYSKVNFISKSPTEYRFNIDNIKQPIYINFTESYNTGWRLRLGNFSWVSVLLNDRNDLPDNNHTRNSAGLNSFYLDPENACPYLTCEKQNDGTYSIYGSIYFLPQAFLILAGVISGTIFFVLLTIFLIVFIKKK